MKNKKRTTRSMCFASTLYFCILCFGMILLNAGRASAAEQTITVNNGDRLTIQVHPNDTGTIVPNPDSIYTENEPEDENQGFDNIDNNSDAADSANDPDDLTNDPADEYGGSDLTETNNQEITYTYSLGWSSDEQYIQIDASGRYQILAPGEADVEITGQNSQGDTVFSAAVHFEILPDMTNVTLEKTKLNAYLVPSYSYGNHVTYESADFDLKVLSDTVLNEDMYGIDLSCKVSSKKVWVDASLTDNVLHLSINGEKKSTVKATVSIAGKNFQITINLKPVKISANSLLMEKGQTKQLKLKGFSGSVKWSSSDKTIASVSKNGLVKGKKTGNIIITAKVGEKPIGCAVCVTTSTLKKVCQRAAYIGANWEYSQDKRFMDGYYDCSALVWKAYKAYAGINFGNNYYPATTATASAWCKEHNRMIKGGYTSKKADKMKLNPGDIVFKSTDLSNPYGTTYHVEMFTGYACLGFNSKGKPITTTLWAAREAGYGAEDGSLWARPVK